MKHLNYFVTLITALATLPATAAPLTIYVSQSGNDNWSGLVPAPAGGGADGPLATLDAARAKIDSLKAAGTVPSDGVRVSIRGGTYHLTHPFALGPADDIAPAPVVYAAYAGERVTLDGGADVTQWTPVTDPTVLGRLDPSARDHVLQADLTQMGISDFGEMVARGFTEGIHPAGLELFFDGKAMTLARWPNVGSWTTTGFPPGITDVGASSQTDRIYYVGDRPSRWAADDDVWLHGYWAYDWSDDYVKAAQIDPASHLIVIAPKQSRYGYVAKHRWYALNILEELDTPGEWYLDRKTGQLYFWPPSDVRDGKASVSLIDEILQLDHVSGVTFRGLTLQDCRASAVTITGGSKVLLDHCMIRDVGNTGVVLDGGTDSGVSHCEITETGEGGVRLGGGDRPSLTPGNCFVQDCRIHDYSRWGRAYRPGVDVTGVGNRVSHNAIYDAPHQAVQLYGNDCIVEYNDIHDVCQETGDAGAFYMGRDWTMRGNILRYNYFHQIGHTGSLVGFSDTMSVYLDDMASGTLVFGNLFVQASHGILIGGGRDNTVANNVFVACAPVVTLDGRGLAFRNTGLAPGGDWLMDKKLAAVHPQQRPYLSHYPELALGLNGDPDAPHGNTLVSNIIADRDSWFITYGVPEGGATLARNLAGQDPLFVDAKAGDYRLKPNSPAFALGFRPIPFDQIGPRIDATASPQPRL